MEKLNIGDKKSLDRELTALEMNLVMFAEKINEIIDHLNTQPQTEEEDQSFDIQTEDEFYQQKKEELQDTPEEEEDEDTRGHEEWEDRLLLCDEAEREYVLGFIYKLLNEREREVEENLLKRLYSATSKKEFRDVLDKFNKEE